MVKYCESFKMAFAKIPDFLRIFCYPIFNLTDTLGRDESEIFRDYDLNLVCRDVCFEETVACISNCSNDNACISQCARDETVCISRE